MCHSVFVEGQRTVLWGQFFPSALAGCSEPTSVYQACSQAGLPLMPFPEPILVYILLLYFLNVLYVCYQMCSIVHAGRPKDDLQQ